ncbi:MAG: hypothetical protein OIF50_05375 [Flavobacteriaceae bacterium]|nr:hypothetical protein [Flavobacteriaceae bacterium]
MIKESSIKISYYDVVGISNHSFNRFKRLDAFQYELNNYYSSIIRKRAGGVTPQIHDLFIEISIPQTLANSLASGSSSQFSKLNFVIQPFIKAYREFKKANPQVDIEELIIAFEDCSIIVDRVCPHSIYNQLENLIDGISENYHLMTGCNSGQIFEIFIPVYDQPVTSIKAVSQLLEPLQINSSNDQTDYYNYWGIYFDTQDNCAVLDLKNKKLTSDILQPQFL